MLQNMPVESSHLKKYAQNTAKELSPSGKRGLGRVRGELKRNLELIRRCFLRVSRFSQNEDFLPREMEWLLDNRYIAEREGRATLHILKELPRLRASGGLPLAYSLASAMARTGEVTPPRLKLFLEGAQELLPLNEDELNAFVPLLKAALVDKVARCCEGINDYLDSAGDARSMRAAELSLRRTEADGGKASGKIKTTAQAARQYHDLLTGIISHAIEALRLFSTLDVSQLLRQVDLLEAQLMRDPAGVYGKMDELSRSKYRTELSRLAKKCGVSTLSAAAEVIKMSENSRGTARHVGYYIFRKPFGVSKPDASPRPYIAALTLPTVLLAALTGLATGTVWAPLLLLLPISEFVKCIADFFILRFKRPSHVFRIEKPEGCKALCVISSLLSSAEDGPRLAAALERYSIANREAAGFTRYGILADLPDSVSRTTGQDSSAVKAAKQAIDALNEKYCGGFYLFLREREYNKKDRKFMAAERKRGAIMELMRLTAGMESKTRVLAGDQSAILKTDYIITLDADTRLNAGSAAELIGAMQHPLNRPVIDPKRKVVARGHALLQPRIGVDLNAASRSLFSSFYAGQGGIDPYSSASGDVYMDLFGQGTYTGKGIIDVSAALKCLDGRFPDGKILSHDLLEGCYLRSGLISDVELSDGWPYKVTSYLVRLHRWTRGDWQLLPYLFRRVKTRDGKREKNPLDELARLRIFDNLRRSLVSPALFAALLAGIIFGGMPLVITALIALICSMSNLLITCATTFFRSGLNGRARYHSAIISGAYGVFFTTLLQLIFLPSTAWFSFSAAVTALWRMLVSKRNLLSWVPASDVEKKLGSGAASFYARMWFAVFSGLLCIFLSPSPFGVAAGITWLFSPALACVLSAEIKFEEKLPHKDRAFLERQGSLIWSWFEEFCSREDNYLPPDNYQEQPAAGIAHRTSPTNIGLAALSGLAAYDLKYISADKAVEYIEKIITSVEKLEKWRGHLLNWYDTRTLKPLRPRCVSTVDSGNFTGCMLALAQGLEQLKLPRAGELALRCKRLADANEFSCLYDSTRRLFYIGYDLETDSPMSGHYDLMASEARLTSYVAISRGDVPRKHWMRLSRALTDCDGYRGMISWTGTMFEYLMPDLLTPVYNNSLLYESAKFCVYAQRRRVRGRSIPWGISESAYCAFDNSLTYQYKAHGVQRLALKRGMDRELVISPYSTFLALAQDAPRAVRNLELLQRFKMEGKYGMFEAADFTPARQPDKCGYTAVKCYMAHHLGMSLLSLDNLLCGKIMQKRFMADERMNAFSELLEEKVPINAPVLKYTSYEIPPRPEHLTGDAWKQQNASSDLSHPRCTLLSNGAYSLLLSDSGYSRANCSQARVYRCDERTQGIVVCVYSNGELFSLTPLPFGSPKLSYSSIFEPSCVIYTAEGGGISARMTVRVSAADNCETREIFVSGTQGDAELVVFFEPVLDQNENYSSHPAFSRLSMSTEKSGHTLIVRRRARGETPGRSLACALDTDEFDFDTSREAALGRGGLYNAVRRPPSFSLGDVLDPCVLLRRRFSLSPSGFKLNLSLSVADRTSDAVQAAERCLNARAEGKSAVNKAAESLDLGSADLKIAMEYLSQLAFPGAGVSQSGGGFDTLWRYGISGDFPILAARFSSTDEKDELRRTIAIHALLTRCGFSFDLLVLVHDTDRYNRPLTSCLKELCAKLGCENQLGSRGGIHAPEISGDDLERVLGFCSAIVGEKRRKDGVRPPALPPARTIVTKTPEYRFAPDGSFTFEAQNLPPLCWSHMLTNGLFGYIAADTGCGNMWSLNARENRITPWLNDPLAVDGGETLSFETDGKEVSLFAGDGACRVSYGFGWASWERPEIKTTAFIPDSLSARILLIQPRGKGTLRLTQTSVLGSDLKFAAGCVTEAQDKVITISNPRNTEFAPQQVIIASSSKMLSFVHGHSAQGWPVLTAEYSLDGPAVLLTGCCRGDGERDALVKLCDVQTAEALLSSTVRRWQSLCRFLTVDTPDCKLNNYLNGWATYQTMACRLLGRSSVYQSGGAYGFRDQLQDCCSLILAAPDAVTEHILLSCAHQYTEGDVQHWWHSSPNGDKGVRTRYSDDLLWLPYTVSRYIEVTGDDSVLDKKARYIVSPPLSANENERYESPRVSDFAGTVYEHCRKAIDLVISRGFGDHGLCLMLGGDWNDGMELVGAGGRGESVWLSWFFIHVLERFSPLCAAMGEQDAADKYLGVAHRLTENCQNAWSNDRYLRAYYDDGSPMGREGDAECAIDAIAQAFAALPQGRDEQRVKTALRTAVTELFDREHSLVRLLWPPFDALGKNPGYIRSYLPGIRENGGQYTHAGVWLAMGCLISGMEQEGWELLRAMLPFGRDDSVFKTEPYVITADVYSNKQNIGRGGWSWYTGAAGWYNRVAVEELLGIRVRGGILTVTPRLPREWDGFSALYKTDHAEIAIKVKRGAQSSHPDGINLSLARGKIEMVAGG